MSIYEYDEEKQYFDRIFAKLKVLQKSYVAFTPP